MSSLDKLRASIRIGSLDINEKLNIELSFTDENFIIYFLDPLNEINIREIKNLFFPYISSDNRTIKMNYLYIKSIFLDGSNLLKFSIYNPISTSLFTIIFNHFKCKNKLIFFQSTPSPASMNSIVLNIKKKHKVQTIKNIKNFINIILIFYQFRSVERRYNSIINKIFLKAFDFGLVYYEKSVKQFNSSQDQFKLFSKEKQKQIKDDINNIKMQISIPQNIPDIVNNSSDPESENNSQDDNLENKKDINSELEIDTINQKDLFQNYSSFEKFSPEIKIMTSYFTEVTINLIYKLFNVNMEDLNNKFNELNKTENGMIINRNITSTIDINTIINVNSNSMDENGIMNNIFENKIKEWFEFCKEFHAYLPNNSMENIISNTSQIIHRKFFEFLFNIFFPDTITTEIGKNKILTPDELHQILKVLRRRKSILFTNQNKEYYKDFEFLNEEENVLYQNNVTFL